MTALLWMLLQLSPGGVACGPELPQFSWPTWNESEESLARDWPGGPPLMSHDRKHHYRWQTQVCLGGVPATMTFIFSGEQFVREWLVFGIGPGAKLTRAQFTKVRGWLENQLGPGAVTPGEDRVSWTRGPSQAVLTFKPARGAEPADLQLSVSDPRSLATP